MSAGMLLPRPYRKPAAGIPASDLAVPGPFGKLVSGQYYYTASGGAVVTSATLGVGILRLIPWFVPNPVTLSRIGAEVSTVGEAGSKVRLGIWADDGNGTPGNLLVDAGTINGDSATVQELTISQALDAGTYWVGGAVQVVTTTQPTVRVLSAWHWPNVPLGTSIPAANGTGVAIQCNGVTGAFASAPTISARVATAPRIFVKAA